VINYYQISQAATIYMNDTFTRPSAVYRTASNWPSTLQQLVNDAKAGKLIQFSYYVDANRDGDIADPDDWGHAIAIIGYKQNANGSHDLIAWNNWYTDFRSIVNISSDYKTCKVENDMVFALEYLSDFSMLNRIDIDGPSNNMTFSAATNGSVANTTNITVPMGSAISITNAAGESLFYDATTGEYAGDIEILSQHMIVNSTVEGGPNSAEIVIEIPNSDTFIFDTEGGIDVSVVNSAIFAAARSGQADAVIVSNADGVYVLGDGAMDYNVSLGVNSTLCDMVSMSGSANSGASLEFKDGDVIAGGAFGTTTMTVFSNTSEVDEIEFEALSNSILVTSALDGSVDLMIDTNTNGTFDTSITEASATADNTALTNGITSAKAIEKGNNTDISFKNLTDAFDAAQRVAANAAATQNEVNAAVAALNATISNLVANTLPSAADLNNALANAKAIAQDGYTNESYQALQDAIFAAQTIADKPNATQVEINDALVALTNAFNGLTENEPTDTKKYISLWGKPTKYLSNGWNWFKVIVLFGWIWMAF
jgi:hypothetical protein